MSYRDDVEDMDTVQRTSIKNTEGTLVTVYVEWSEKDQPQKCKQELQMALQTWFNRNTENADCSVLGVLEDGSAVIKITPALAQDKLLKLTGAILIRKDQKTFTIKSFSQTASVGAVCEPSREIRAKLPGIGARGKYSAWRMAGLQETLGPAVHELERTLRGPVFKEEDKQRIGYSRYTMSNVGAAMEEGGATAGGTTGENEEETCPICMDTFTNKEKLKCSHEFCKECLTQSVKYLGPICPVCKAVFGKVEGDQPGGKMSCSTVRTQLPGFLDCGTVVITYDIPSGKQTEKHPNPGQYYNGLHRTAYLPDNKEGREVVRLLKRAFNQKLIFTVGTSRITGAEDQVIWNDIHHKTNIYGGSESFGYPDPGYLSRVREELKAKGIE